MDDGAAHPSPGPYRFDEIAVELEYRKDDNIAPDVVPSGQIADRDEGYAGVGALGLRLTGDDAAPAIDSGEPVSGIANLHVRLDGSGPLTIANADCSTGCPATFAHDFTIDTALLPEGEITLLAEATDAAYNVGGTDLSLTVDENSVQRHLRIRFTDFDPDASTVSLDWIEGEDPDLADGNLGAGVKYTEYRRRDAHGDWGSWHRFEDAGDATLRNVDEGEEVDVVELRSIDSVGNQSAVIADTLTVTADEESPAAGRSEIADFEACTFTVDFMDTDEKQGDIHQWISRWRQLGAQLKMRCRANVGVAVSEVRFLHAHFAKRVGTDAEGKPIYQNVGRNTARPQSRPRRAPRGEED